MSQGFTGTLSPGTARAANTVSTASMTLPYTAVSPCTFPITGTNLITSITASRSGQVVLLEFASAGCRVVMGSNLLINGDYLSTAGGILTLVANGSNWEEVARTSAIIQPYNAHPNGGFEVWQRPFTTGTQYTSVASGQQTADLWRMTKVGAMVCDVVQDTSVPGPAMNAINTPYSLKINVTTADASIAAGDVYAMVTPIEGYHYRALTNGFAVSWWAKAHRTGTYCLTFSNGAVTREYAIEYTIAVADTWQYFTAVVPAPITSGVWSYTNGVGMYCIFGLAGGSSFNGAVANGAWGTVTDGYMTANQVNGVAATTDTFSLWGLNIVPGTVPQPYNPMPLALQLGQLRRYCQVFGGRSSSTVEMIAQGHVVSTTQADFLVNLSPIMLASPTLTLSAQIDFNIWDAGGVAHVCTAFALSNSTWNSPERVMLLATVASGLVAGSASTLFTNATTSRIIFEATPA